jgi:hypothetical protein
MRDNATICADHVGIVRDHAAKSRRSATSEHDRRTSDSHGGRRRRGLGLVGGIGHRSATGARGPTTRGSCHGPDAGSTADPLNHTTDVIVRAQCAELDPLASLRSTQEIRSFRNSEFPPYSNTKNILLRMDPPVLSSPVLSCGHARFGQMSESMRTKSGQNADTNRTGALRTRFGLKLGVSRRRRPRAGHLSRASACGHRWTSVRTDADRMRTKSGQMSASKRTKSGQDADEKRTRPQPISMDGRSSARMHAAMTAPVVSLSPRR